MIDLPTFGLFETGFLKVNRIIVESRDRLNNSSDLVIQRCRCSFDHDLLRHEVIPAHEKTRSLLSKIDTFNRVRAVGLCESSDNFRITVSEP